MVVFPLRMHSVPDAWYGEEHFGALKSVLAGSPASQHMFALIVYLYLSFSDFLLILKGEPLQESGCKIRTQIQKRLQKAPVCPT